MMFKRWFTMMLFMVTLLGLAACGKDGGETTAVTSSQDAPISTPTEATQAPQVYAITIWVPVDYVELTQMQIEQFNTDHAGQYRFEATVVAEQEAVNKLRYKTVPAPDLFFFRTEEEMDLVTAYGLAVALGTQKAQTVAKEHHASAVAAASRGEHLYAYPVSFAPSGVMFYDKSVISSEDIGSLEALIAACEDSGRGFSFAQPTHSFFSATGCVSDWIIDEEGEFVSVNDTYNSPEGLIALEHLRLLVQSACYWDSNDVGNFKDKVNSAVVISSLQYFYEQAKEILGDNLGVAQLPSFEHEGKTYQLMTDSQCYLLGISPQEDGARLAALQMLAQYLTGDVCQLQRYEAFGLLPSNLKAQQVVQQEVHCLETVWEQSCTVRKLRNAAWWQYMSHLQYNVRDGIPLENALSRYEWSVNDLFRDYTWSVIGSFPGMSWTGYFCMAQQSDGTYRTEEALCFEESTEFKILYQTRWDVNYGADGELNGENIKPGVAGYFYVVFDPQTCLCRLEPQ